MNLCHIWSLLIAAVGAHGAFSRYRGGIFAGCDPNVRSEMLSLRMCNGISKDKHGELEKFDSNLVTYVLHYLIFLLYKWCQLSRKHRS